MSRLTHTPKYLNSYIPVGKSRSDADIKVTLGGKLVCIMRKGSFGVQKREKTCAGVLCAGVGQV